MPEGERWAAVDVDLDVNLSRPNAAQVDNWLLGGGLNFRVDRELGDRLVALEPSIELWVQARRRFLQRAVKHVLDVGVRQVLDIGAGIPAAGAVHEVTARAAPDTQVVYVDADPVPVQYARRLAGRNPRVTAVQGDLRAVDCILAHPDVRAAVDLSQPVAVLLVGVVQYLSDSDNPAEILARLREVVVPGSFLVVSHACPPAGMTLAQVEAVRLYSEQVAPVTLRTRQQVQELFTGWRLVAPGVCSVESWRRPEHHDLGEQADARPAAVVPGWAGVAVKTPVAVRAAKWHGNGPRRLSRVPPADVRP